MRHGNINYIQWTGGFFMSIAAAFMVPHPPLIIPEVGRGAERLIQDTIDGYRKVAERIGRIQPETIVVISWTSYPDDPRN